MRGSFAKARPLAASAVVLALAVGGCNRASQPIHAESGEGGPAPAPVTVQPHPALTQTGGVSVADVAERALPSVVNISLTKLSRMRGGFPFGGPREQRQEGQGSGVIISSDGYIVTNNHVVSGATEIKVTTYDHREYTADVVGTDPKTDLAVIKLKGDVSGLKAIEWGDSSQLRLGDVVLAIGNPFGVGQTVTMGIVSAKGRADLGINQYEDFIQTDAAINPGNSGGALVNMQGKLVGINSAILSPTGGNQGIGFAIPTAMAAPIFDSLKQTGRVARGWLGVSIQDVDQELVGALKLPVTRGILISDVRAGAPAARAGLRRGDVVTKVDGRAIETTGQFRNQVAAAGAGRKVALEVVREGKTVGMTAELGEMPGDEGNLSPPSSPSTKPQSGVLDGINLTELDAESRKSFDIAADVQKGVVVTRVAPGSPAARAGLRAGDVLLELNRAAVANVRDFEAAYGKAKDNLLLLVHRGGATVFVVVKR
jgi:serine protease Do